MCYVFSLRLCQELILSEARARSSVAELQQMLKDLREAEEFTDDLVDRLKNKVL